MSHSKRRRGSDDNNVVQNFKSVISKMWSVSRKWFQNEDASTDDLNTDPESLSQSEYNSDTQPPQPKRKRLNSSENGINFYATSSLQYEGGESEEPCCSYNIQQRPRNNLLRKDTNFIPHRSSGDDTDTMFERKTPAFKTEYSISKNTHSTIKNSPIDLTSSDKQGSSSEIKGPSKHTPVPEPEWNKFRASQLGSPFYAGSTMYGGAASACYLNTPNVTSCKQVTVSKNTSNDSANLASVAVKKLSEVMEISDTIAREANYLPSQSAIRKKRNEMSSLRSLPELRVPNPARFLNMKRMRGIMQSSVAARQIMASASSSIDMYPSANTSPQRTKSTTKIKSAITRKRAVKGIEDEIAPKVNLPNTVLEIDKNKMPKLSFATSTAMKPKPVVEEQTQKIDQFMLSSPQKCNSFEGSNSLDGDSYFSFSAPLVEDLDKPPQFLHNESVDASTTKVQSKSDFPKPIENGYITISDIVSKTSTKEKPRGNRRNSDDNKTETSNSNVDKWKCDSCWVFNTNVSSCVCCGSSKPIVKIPTPKKPEPAVAVTWKCEDCWIMNQDNVQKCIACGGNKPTQKTVELTKKASTDVTQTSTPAAPQNPFKLNETSSTNGDWKCEVCLVKIPSDITVCVACGVKPSSRATSSPSKPKVAEQKWECPCCLVRNDNDRLTCACCEAAKPGAAKAPEKNTFNFGTASGTSFKFGITPTSEKTDVVQAKPAESEKNNNVLPNTISSGFSFGIPKVKDVTDAKTDATASFTFGFSAKPVTTESTSNKEVEQEVPKMPVVTVSETKSAIPTFSFTAKTTAAAPSTFKPILMATPSLLIVPEKKLEPAVSAASAPQTVPSILSENKLATPNIFGLPATTTAVSTVPVLSPIQPAANILETPKTTSSSMFSFSSGTPKVSQSPSTTGPIFSFGSNSSTQPAAAAPAVAPKFNFSFGGSSSSVSSWPPPPTNSNLCNSFTNSAQPAFGMNSTQANGPATPIFGAVPTATASAPAPAPAPAFSFGGKEISTTAMAFNFQAPSSFGGNHVPMFGASATPAAAPAPTLAPAPAPAPAPYNFGSPTVQPSGGFNFGNNPVYTFGTPCAPTGPVQFNMGSGPTATPANIAGRKFRKAARRSTAPR